MKILILIETNISFCEETFYRNSFCSGLQMKLGFITDIHEDVSFGNDGVGAE